MSGFIPMGSPSLRKFIAGEDVGAGRVVYLASDGTVKYASNDDISTMDVVGITKQAAYIYNEVLVFTSGRANDSAWNFTIGGPVYLGINGLTTQTPPTTGFTIKIGVALENDILSFHPETAIELI